MSSQTTNLKMIKPASTDTVEESIYVNANLDIIDNALPYQIVTSGARPSSPPDGLMIYETDKKRVRVWDASTGVWQIIYGHPFCSIGLLANQGGAGNGLTVVDFTKVITDTDNMANLTDNRVVIKEKGIYWANLNIHINPTTSPFQLAANIRRNGIVKAQANLRVENTAAENRYNLPYVGDHSVGTYLDCTIFNSSTESLTIESVETRFQVLHLRSNP